jgi:hypothetical protein
VFKTTGHEFNPLLGGAEAEGFGVGVGREGPTPALRATPPMRGFSGSNEFSCKIRVLTQGPVTA